MLAALGLAVASLASVALGSDNATAREGPRSIELANALVAGRDGTLTVAGLSERRGRVFALARYTADGTLDRRFGTGGRVLTAFGAPTYAGAKSLAIRPDGRIVAAGYAHVRSAIYFGFAIARYTVAGELDRTFARNGKVVTSFGSPRQNSSALAVAIQPDGKVVAAGHGTGFRIGLTRYTVRGRLDRSFGRGGKVVTDVDSGTGAAEVAIQPDGRIVAAGTTYRGTRTDLALARYHPNGTLDRSFGAGGRVVTKVGEGDSYPSALVAQPDGKLVVAGIAHATRHDDFALVRYTRDGRLDPSFGVGGTVVSTTGNPHALAVQRDGKLVTTGTDIGRRYREFVVARWLEDGSPDPSFGRGGRVRTDFDTGATANAVVLRPDGKIVVAGTVGGRDFALARYTSRGRLDVSFGSRGKVLTDFGSAWAVRGR
jgi:uncharacterized delta-60 repeat protein